jgi:protein transport protein SEC24
LFQNNTFPNPPALLFLIDVSYNNVKSGMVHLLCAQMKEILKLLPKEEGAGKSNLRVGFITYNKVVHFYNIKVRDIRICQNIFPSFQG